MYIISGTYKGRLIHSPKTSLTRPTSARLREAVFNICQGDIEGAHALDLFAGSGAIGLEALSRGAAKATFIDSHRASASAIQHTLLSLKNAQGKILCKPVLKALSELSKNCSPYDFTYIDPPYNQAQEAWQAAITLVDLGLLRPFAHLFIETVEDLGPDLTLPKTLQQCSKRRSGSAILWHYRYNP